ncbi:MAG: hypothetical protein C4526_11120 [Nitrospiraceae bacterium]|nr:MAG: hypothetical protein C4526_11120 [Nitrospiraceae bacterium]
MFIRLTGIIGLALVLCGYYLFWISPDTEISEAITRTRAAIVVNLSGNIMIVYYLFKRQS